MAIKFDKWTFVGGCAGLLTLLIIYTFSAPKPDIPPYLAMTQSQLDRQQHMMKQQIAIMSAELKASQASAEVDRQEVQKLRQQLQVMLSQKSQAVKQAVPIPPKPTVPPERKRVHHQVSQHANNVAQEANQDKVHLRGQEKRQTTTTQRASAKTTNPYPFLPMGNVLFLMADQHRHDAMGVAGNRVVRTPNLDRLAREGVRFTDATTYVPTCVPARAALLTGAAAEENEIFGGREMDKVVLRPNFGKLLGEYGGFQTGFYGKWHNNVGNLGEGWSDTSWGPGSTLKGSRPVTSLMSEYMGKYSKFLAQHVPQKDRYPQAGERNKVAEAWGFPWQQRLDFGEDVLKVGHGLAAKGGKNEHMKNWATAGTFRVPVDFSESMLTANETVAALHRYRQSNIDAILAGHDSHRPFCFVTSLFKPHPPYLVSQGHYEHFEKLLGEGPNAPAVKSGAYVDPINHASDSILALRRGKANKLHAALKRLFSKNEKARRTLAKLYYASVEETDAAIGHILDTLEKLGLKEHTFVVYTSDHGEMLTAHGRIGKSILYEESVRVPLLMRFPKHIPPGLEVHTPCSLIDVIPTIVDYVMRSNDPKKSPELASFAAAKASDTNEEWVSAAPWTFHGSSLKAEIEVAMRRKSGDMSSVSDDSAEVRWGGGLTAGKDWRRAASVTLERAKWYLVRTREWKLIYDFNRDSTDAMYNVKEDPFELINLAADNPNAEGKELAIRKRLKPLLGEAEDYLRNHLRRWLRYLRITTQRRHRQWMYEAKDVSLKKT